MSGWQPRDPAQVGLNPADYPPGTVPTVTAGTFAPTPLMAGHTVDAGQPQTDGSILYRYGIDPAGRPTWTPTGTDDIPGIVTVTGGRFYIQEATL